ncbi:MAG: glycosyltransferase [Sulfuricaulis sp.]
MLTSVSSTGVDAKRIIVVDPSLTDFIGHHAQYDISVIENAEQSGIKGLVLSHKSACDTIGRHVQVIRTFSEDMWGTVKTWKFGWLDLKLFALGCISTLVAPTLAYRNIARLRRWFAAVLSQRKQFLSSHGHRINNSLVKFVIYALLNLVPSGISTVRYYKRKLPNMRRLLQLLMPPVLWKIKNVIVLLLPPFFFKKVNFTSIVFFPFRVFLVVLRLFVPRLVIQLWAGIVEKCRISNFIGSLTPRLIFFAFDNPRYYLEAERALSAAGLETGDLVFFHMVIGRNVLETAALCEAIYSKTRIAPVVLLRYPPSFLASVHPICLKLAIRKFEYLFEAGKLRLASDSHRLIDEYAKVTYVPFELFPIPHGASHLPKCDLVSTENSRVTIASLGNARGEKGFIEIFKMMRRLADSTSNLPVKFVIQANDPDDDAAPYVNKLKKARFPFPVSVITKSLDKNAYESLVASADVILAPYWREIYSSRTSGVALEAIVGGKILIATKDTWMSDQTRLWQTGLTVENRSTDSLTDAVLRAIANKDTLILRARTAREAAAKFHSGKSFIEHLMRKKHSWTEMNKNVCFLYPWNNLLQYNSGASVYSSLMIKKIVEAGWHVTVMGQLHKSVVLPKGVTAIHRSDPLATFSNPLYLADYVQRLLLSPQMIGLEDFQYRFHFWMRSRAAKLAINSVLRCSSAVVIQYPFLASLIAPFAKAYEIPMVLNSLDVLSQQTKRRKLRRWILEKEIRAFNCSRFPSVISEEDRQTFEKFGVRTHVIANSVDVGTFTLPSLQEAHRRIVAAGIELPFERFGLFVGSAHPPNFAAAKRVAELSRDELLGTSKIGFVIVGDCVLLQPAMITQNCRYLGRVPNAILQALYTLTSFVVIPLESGTGSSVKTLEAFAYGKAVIGTNIAFRGFDVVNSYHCLISNNFDEYPSLIIKLLSDGEWFKELGANAKVFAKTRDYRVTYQPVVDAIKSCQHW